jgi:uncharacterized protein YjiK
MRNPKFLILASLIFLCCTPKNTTVETRYTLPEGYQLENHSKVKLPDELNEISGVFWSEDFLWAVDDEHGDLFQIDPKDGSLKNRVKFGKDEDFEDLAIVGDTAWVLRSNGDLYRVTNFLQTNPQTEVFEFPQKGKRDFETLIKKPNEHALMIICKNCEWDKKGESSVFEFDRTTGSFKESPVQTLKFNKVEGMESGFPDKKPSLEPSAAAFHPLTGELFILSSAGKWLMVTSPDFSPKSIHALDPELFGQPEGISFDVDGTLYISNEGQNKKPNLLIFPFTR